VKTMKMPFRRFLLLVSLVALTLLLLVAGSLLYAKTKRFIDGKMDDITEMKLNQVTADTKSQLEDVLQTLDGLRNNDGFRAAVDKLESGQTPSYDAFVQSKNLDVALFTMKKDNALIERIALYTKRLQYSSDSLLFGYLTGDRQRSLFRAVDRIRFVPPGGTFAVLGIDRATLDDAKIRSGMDELNASAYLIGPFPAQSGEEGVVIVQLAPDSLRQLVPYAESMALVESGGSVLFRGAELAVDSADAIARLRARALDDGGSFHGKRYYQRDIGFFGMQVVFAEEKSDFHRRQLRAVGGYAAAALVGCALLSLLLTRLIGRQIMLPLHKLIRWMGREEHAHELWLGKREPWKRPGAMVMRDRLFLYFIVTVLLPALLFIVLFYVQSNRVVSRELQQTYYAAFEKVAHRIDLFVKMKQAVLARLAYDAEVVDFVSEPNDTNRKALDRLLSSHKPSFLSEDVLSIYDAGNRLLYSNWNKASAPLPQSFYDEMSHSRKSIYYDPRSENSPFAASLGIAVFDLKLPNTPLGFIAVHVAEIYFAHLYADLKANGSFAYMVDDKGHILSHPDPDKIGQTDTAGVVPERSDGGVARSGEALYFVGKIGLSPYYLVYKYDDTVLRKQSAELIYSDIYLLVIIFLLIVLLAYGMSQYLVKPLGSLQTRYLHLQLDNFPDFLTEGSYMIDEVDQLQKSFGRMLDRIKTLADEKLAADRRHMLLQIDALQAQVDPHFLHNTFEHVMYLIDKSEPERAGDMIGLLSRMFRYAMGKENAMTRVAEEVRYARTYVQLMGIRYRERLRCDWQVDETAQDGGAIKMIVQPLLENAIRYSLAEPGRSVAIAVVVRRRDDDTVEVVVRDDGPGVPEPKLAELRGLLRTGSRGSVGLYNVHNRVRLIFGEAYGVEIDSKPGAGTTVRLRLPFRQANGESTENRIEEA